MRQTPKQIIDTCLCADSETIRRGQGKNVIPPPEKEPIWKGFLEKFKDPIIIVLLVAFVFSLGVSIYEMLYLDKPATVLLEPLGVFVALILATGIGFIFEVKANREFDILNKVKDSRPVKVLRRQTPEARPKMYEIKRRNVVVGDIVKLESGDEVPADGKLLWSKTLRMDESDFTGELETVKSEDETHFREDDTYPTNRLLRGTTVIEGIGLFRVDAVGLETEEGKGVRKTREGSDVKTPLNIQLDQLGGLISKISFIIAALIIAGRMMYYFFWDGNTLNNSNPIELIEFFINSIMIAVTLIVVAVPEGLPMSITVSLALSMRKMLKENNLVRKLHACETMGAATVICTDKTGTLTKNRMTVMDIDFMPGIANDIIYDSIAVNSTAEIETDEQGKKKVVGNPTEGALLRWLTNKGVDYFAIREKADILEQVPFSTEAKYMETVIQRTDGRKSRFIKGAPEIVIGMCDDAASNDFEAKLADYQSRAMRTLAFAYQDDIDDNSPIQSIGIVGISDPIREDVADAIKMCRDNAGVRVVIVTGDTPGTAREIGRQIGLISDEKVGEVLTGPEFEDLSDEDAMKLLKHIKIIARAKPNDKARLVELLQRMGEVVAVTGDGTNDAPALSKAQVGLSMGDGTSRAKEASDITIIDNSFSSINKAIMWGRSIYLNIRRFNIFQMTINVCACLIVLVGAFVGLDSPLTVTQMLWVNLIMDTFAAMALSSLPASKSVLYEKPRNPKSHIIDNNMWHRIVWVGVVFFVFLAGLWQLLWHCDITSVRELLDFDHARTYVDGFGNFAKIKQHLSPYEVGVFFTTFVLLQFWNIFNARYYHTGRSLLVDIIGVLKGDEQAKSDYSRSFVLILAVILIGQVIIVTFGGKMFDVSPLSVEDWGWILLITAPILLIPDAIRTVKYLLRRNG